MSRICRTHAFTYVSAIAFLVGTPLGASAQNYLLNPSFELPVVGSGSYLWFLPGDTIGAGWVVDSADIHAAVIDQGYQRGGATWYPPTDGTQYLYVGDSFSVSSLHQDVTLSAGGSYRLTFDLANFVHTVGPTYGARVVVDVISLASASSVLGGGQVFTRALNAGYGAQQVDFVAAQPGGYRVTITSVDDHGSNVDNFVLAQNGPIGTPYCFGDGSGTSCPCGNLGAFGNGCPHSLNANGAGLAATGASSIGADSVVLSGSGMPDSSALYFQGTTQQNGGSGSVFGDGLRCAAGTIIRLGTRTNVSGASQYPGAGDPSVSVRGLITSPGIRTYQVWYRNAAAFCTPSTFNLTNGWQVSWTM